MDQTIVGKDDSASAAARGVDVYTGRELYEKDGTFLPGLQDSGIGFCDCIKLSTVSKVS